MSVVVGDNIASNSVFGCAIVFPKTTLGLEKGLPLLVDVRPLGNTIVGEPVFAIWNMSNDIVYGAPEWACCLEIERGKTVPLPKQPRGLTGVNVQEG